MHVAHLLARPRDGLDLLRKELYCLNGVRGARHATARHNLQSVSWQKGGAARPNLDEVSAAFDLLPRRTQRGVEPVNHAREGLDLATATPGGGARRLGEVAVAA